MTISVPPRKEILHFEPYVPGRDMETVKKQYHLSRVVKLASNENPLGPSPKAVAALRKATGNLHRYPDGFSLSLREAIALKNRVALHQVTVGAGSDEIIEILAKTYLNPSDNIVVSEHAFLRYRMAGDLMGARVISVPMKKMEHDLEAMAKAVTSKTKLIFVANPNNPTGTWNTLAQVNRFLKALPSHVLPVVDEAYFEFAEHQTNYPNTIELFKAGAGVITLRTFSKAYGLAGVRLGYGVGPASVIEALERVRPPFNVSLPAQAAGVAALNDVRHIQRTVDLTLKEKTRVEKILRDRGVEFLPSAGNFLLIRVAPKLGKDVFERLLRQGVIVRSMDEYGFHQHVRVTIGRPADNNLFLQTLRRLS